MRVLNLVPAFAALLQAAQCAPLPKTPGIVHPAGNVEMPTKNAPIAEGLWHGNVSTTGENNTGIKTVLTYDHYCQNSTFENRVTTASPLVEDCLKLRDNIAGSGIW